MRAALTLGALALLGTTVRASEPSLPFPASLAGGKSRLEAWATARQPQLPTTMESISRGSGEIVMVYHHSGSGRPLVDAYVYGCNAENCSLLAFRRWILIPQQSIERPIRAQVRENGTRLEVRTSDGVVQLQVAIPSN